MSDSSSPDFEVVSQIIAMLKPLALDAQKHILTTVCTWLRLPIGAVQPSAQMGFQPPQVGNLPPTSTMDFSPREEISPKHFLLEKDPKTDTEKIACLAYYLTHYRDTPHFKTMDLSLLNTEAAQRKLSNTAYTSNNAVRDGFFTQAPGKGRRQLSALGERYVEALPDREASKVILARLNPKRAKAITRRPHSNGTMSKESHEPENSSPSDI